MTVTTRRLMRTNATAHGAGEKPLHHLREKGNEMNDRLKERIREFNRRAEMAERDGYTVAEGYVCEGWGNPTGPCARKVCKVEDYEQSR